MFSIALTTEGVDVTTYETATARVVFKLTNEFSVVSATPSDGYWTWKPKFDPGWRGRADHIAMTAVRAWSRQTWTDYQIPVAGIEAARNATER